jgi:hypothetical protein
MATTYTITQTGDCHIRTGPSLSSSATGKVRKKGTVWTSTERVIEGPRHWYHDSTGWTSSGTGYAYMTVKSDEQQPTPAPTPQAPPPPSGGFGNVPTIGTGNSPWLEIKEPLRGINGLPFQFLDTADIRLSEISSSTQSPYGKMYHKRILERMPLLMLSPGGPKFLEGKTKKDRTDVLMGMVNQGSLTKTQLTDLLDGVEGRLYTFEFQYQQYYEKVNMLARATAEYLGIGYKLYNGIPLKSYDWGKDTGEGTSFKKFFSANEVVPFYVEGEVSVSDSIGNQSRESSLGSQINQMSETVKEMEFFLGNAGLNVANRPETDIMRDREVIEKAASAAFGFMPQGFIDRISDASTTIVSGGKLDYPEIFGDSSFSKDYSVKMKFTSPYGNTLAIYLYCLIPLIKLLAMTIPKQISPNSYGKPFLVRGFLRSVFSVDVGLITGLSFNKGQEGSWNIDHLPTQIDVDLSIKDLYSGLYLPNTMTQFLNNTLMMDFIANLCGIDIAKIELDRKLKLWLDDKYNLVSQDIWRNTGRLFEEKVSNLMRQYLGR